MSRSSARDEDERDGQLPGLGRMVLSQGRSGGANSDGATAVETDQKHIRGTQASTEDSALGLSRPEPVSHERETILVRDRAFRISPQERELMMELGRFRTVAVADLAEFRYANRAGSFRQVLGNLKLQGLIRQPRVMVGKGREKFSVLVLTKDGKRVLEQEPRTHSQQALYAGFVKPQEVAHDATLYRMYQAESAQIEKRGGTIRRVVLDYELKKNVYSPLAKARALPPLEFAKRQTEVARDNGLKVIKGKIPLPDLRIEYESADGELAKVDLELATEHYHGAHAAEKAKAGFKMYADRASASRLNAALTYGRSPAQSGSEFTVEILSL